LYNSKGEQKLAREVFFGDQILLQSTVTGRSSGLALDEQKLELMQIVIRTKLYPDMNFKAIVWVQCKAAIGEVCKALRQKSISGGFPL
jgi:hypothetical protein